MTEQPKTQAGSITINIDQLQKIIPTLAKYYTAFSWILPLAGFEIPPEADAILRSIASGEPLTPEKIEALKQSSEAMKPLIGEPVMTKQLAETAYYLHTKEHLGTREIAEQFTKDGSPVSHATVARWINMIEAEKQLSKMAWILRMAKWVTIGGLWILSIVLVYLYL